MLKMDITYNRRHEAWVDYMKAFACILVVGCHFFQSMVTARILSDSHFYRWLNMTVYDFHVPLFFICSGYVYRKYSKVCSVKTWIGHAKKKAITLGVPYISFTVISLCLKVIAADSVNNPGGDFIDTLLVHPIPPYWFLYVLLLIFLITPTCVRPKNLIIVTVLAAAAKYIVMLSGISMPYALSNIFQYEIWFVLGMGIAVWNWEKVISSWMAAVCGLLFLAGSMITYAENLQNSSIGFTLGLLACVSVVGIFYTIQDNKVVHILLGGLSRYTMPVFLMHTIAAAGIRAVMMKIGITDAFTHVVIGLGMSFLGPIAIALLIKEVKYLEFFLYPGKYVKFSKGKGVRRV